MNRPVVYVSTLTLLSLLTACGGSGGGDAGVNGQVNALSKNVIPAQVEASPAETLQVDITSYDGVIIKASIFKPALKAGEVVPLLVHSHGFGGSRTKSLDFDQASQADEIAIDTMQIAYDPSKTPGANRSPWYVISYDQRGHGDSGGNVQALDPNIEGKDFKAVLDWAEKNLPHLARYQATKKPVIGTIGRSYGGGFQLMGAGVDDRISAMVPDGTWYDLRYSLDTNGVPKTSYLNALIIAGAQSIKGRFDQFLYDGLARANTTTDVSPEVLRKLGSHGTSAYCLDEPAYSTYPLRDAMGNFTIDTYASESWKQVPAFFVQGSTDVLFNLNEGIQNFECYRKNNAASKLLMVKYGHSLDALSLQKTPDRLHGGKYAFNESVIAYKDPSITSDNCPVALDAKGRCLVQTRDLMFEFLAANLLGSDAVTTSFLGKKISPLPTIASVIDDGSTEPVAVVLQNKLTDTQYTVFKGNGVSLTNTQSVVSGTPAAPTSLLSSFNQAAPYSTQFATLNGSLMFSVVSPTAFNTPANTCYVGTPTADITVASPVGAESPEAPTIFVGLVLENADGTQTILHDQVVPVKGYVKNFKTVLPGISTKVKTGQQLKLIYQGYNPFFVTSFNRTPNWVNVTATVTLPAATPCP